MLSLGPPPAEARRIAEKALPLLEAALLRDARDFPAWEAKGDALRSLGRPQEALAAYETLLAARPESESALNSAATLALELNRIALGQSFLERAVVLNPWDWRIHHRLAAAAFLNKQWDKAAGSCRTSLQIEPFQSTTRRKLLVECCVRLGQKQQARVEFETLRLMTPEDQRSGLVRWFAELLP